MRTFIYLVVACLGVLLSIPITILIIAIQTAKSDVEKIKEHLEKQAVIKK